MRVAAEIALSKEERRRLESWATTRSTSVRLRERARIVLMAAQGMTNKEIAAELEVDANKVGRWRARVAKEGTSSIEKERPRGANHGGKNAKKQAQLRSEVVEATTQTTPNDATHWSCRSMARHLNTTHSFVNRVWRAHGLKPHLIRTFKLSNDPRFEEKLRDVVGLYLDPPHNAAVFSFDEKSQIQALDRTQPGLPMKKGRCATMTHDYKRHGTTTLFAALNMATGEVIGKTYRKHRHQEVLRFLREVEKTVPKEQEIHIVLDNYATHKHEKVLAWIERKKRVFLHFIPTSASWARSSGSLGFSRKNRFVEVSLHRCRIWRSACASTWRATTRIHAPWSGQSPSRKSSKKSVGVERSYPKQLNHYFVKDTTLAQKKPCHYIRVLDAILNGGSQGLWSAISFSTSIRRTVLGNLTPTHCAILPATPTVLLRTTKLLPL